MPLLPLPLLLLPTRQPVGRNEVDRLLNGVASGWEEVGCCLRDGDWIPTAWSRKEPHHYRQCRKSAFLLDGRHRRQSTAGSSSFGQPSGETELQRGRTAAAATAAAAAANTSSNMAPPPPIPDLVVERRTPHSHCGSVAKRSSKRRFCLTLLVIQLATLVLLSVDGRRPINETEKYGVPETSTEFWGSHRMDVQDRDYAECEHFSFGGINPEEHDEPVFCWGRCGRGCEPMMYLEEEVRDNWRMIAQANRTKACMTAARKSHYQVLCKTVKGRSKHPKINRMIAQEHNLTGLPLGQQLPPHVLAHIRSVLFNHPYGQGMPAMVPGVLQPFDPLTTPKMTMAPPATEHQLEQGAQPQGQQNVEEQGAEEGNAQATAAAPTTRSWRGRGGSAAGPRCTAAVPIAVSFFVSILSFALL